MRQVKIIGGGLAGLGLGIALRRNSVPVEICEAGHYPRHRVCGEFITSLDRHTREGLQLDDILEAAHTARHVSWCEDGKNDIAHELPQPALCLSRHRLDESLAEKFLRLGGELHTGAREECVDEPGRVHACGRKPDPSSSWVGIKQHFHGLETNNDLEVHFGAAGYIGVTKVENDTVNVCGLLKRGAADFTQPLAVIARQGGFARLSRRLQDSEAVGDSFCAVAGLAYESPAADKLLHIGDRAGLIPPFTGNGMTIALQSAIAAAPALTAWAHGNSGWQETRGAATKALEHLFSNRRRFARILHPLILHPGARSFARTLDRMGVLPVGLLYRMMH